MRGGVLLALKLVTFPGPLESVIILNPEDVVSLKVPHRGFDPKVKCIINMIDGNHVAVAIGCEEVKRRLQE